MVVMRKVCGRRCEMFVSESRCSLSLFRSLMCVCLSVCLPAWLAGCLFISTV